MLKDIKNINPLNIIKKPLNVLRSLAKRKEITINTSELTKEKLEELKQLVNKRTKILINIDSEGLPKEETDGLLNIIATKVKSSNLTISFTTEKMSSNQLKKLKSMFIEKRADINKSIGEIETNEMFLPNNAFGRAIQKFCDRMINRYYNNASSFAKAIEMVQEDINEKENKLSQAE